MFACCLLTLHVACVCAETCIGHGVKKTYQRNLHDSFGQGETYINRKFLVSFIKRDGSRWRATTRGNSRWKLTLAWLCAECSLVHDFEGRWRYWWQGYIWTPKTCLPSTTGAYIHTHLSASRLKFWCVHVHRYHIVHHINSRLHWSEMPQRFVDELPTYAAQVFLLMYTRTLTTVSEGCYYFFGLALFRSWSIRYDWAVVEALQVLCSFVWDACHWEWSRCNV